MLLTETMHVTSSEITLASRYRGSLLCCLTFPRRGYSNARGPSPYIAGRGPQTWVVCGAAPFCRPDEMEGDSRDVTVPGYTKGSLEYLCEHVNLQIQSSTQARKLTCSTIAHPSPSGPPMRSWRLTWAGERASVQFLPTARTRVQMPSYTPPTFD